MVGKGKKVSDYDSSNHQSAPLSSLQDPAQFGPPPKRTGTSDSFGSAGSPRTSTAPSTASSGGGLGTTLGRDYGSSLQAKRDRERREAEEEAEMKANAPPVPYRTDTTGLSTAGFAPPPKPRLEDGTPPAASARAKPGLPPRLPARAAAVPATPPPSYEHVEKETVNTDRGVMNQGSLNRLGQAGISVPGLGIGAGPETPPRLPTRHQASPAPAPASPPAAPQPSVMGHGGQMNELQARFARMNSTSSSAAGDTPQARIASPTSPTGKKPPPPPPPKKKELHSEPTGAAAAPPPIPLASKPR